jgi:hypothetical protein
MAKILDLSAPKSMRLASMKADDVAQYVSKFADETLARMPDDLRPVGVNAVTLSQLAPGTKAAPGIWAEWTRACCNRRDRIEEFVDPVVDQFERPGSPVSTEVRAQHLESQLRVFELEHPTMHRKG